MRAVLLFSLALIGCNEPYSTHDRELGRIMEFIQDSQTFDQSPLDLTTEGKGAIEDYWQNLDSWSVIRKIRVLHSTYYNLKLKSKSGKEGKITVYLGQGPSRMSIMIWPYKEK